MLLDDEAEADDSPCPMDDFFSRAVAQQLPFSPDMAKVRLEKTTKAAAVPSVRATHHKSALVEPARLLNVDGTEIGERFCDEGFHPAALADPISKFFAAGLGSYVQS